MPVHPLPLQYRAVRTVTAVAVAALVLAGCSSAPAPPSGGPEPAEGTYDGQLVIEGRPFEATLTLRRLAPPDWSGSLSVVSPVEIEGDVRAVSFEDLMRIRVEYTGADGCAGRIEGILDLGRDGEVPTLQGPVTIHDECGEPVGGSMTFRHETGEAAAQGERRRSDAAAQWLATSQYDQSSASTVGGARRIQSRRP